ncbi:MAG: hypothetical protein H7301_04290 [Cryobacterium sp.]|nr:hypothetical protein [Oligoflexia bacterium]
MTDDPLSISGSRPNVASWNDFLPAGAVLMGRLETEASLAELSGHPEPIAAATGGARLRFQFEIPGIEDPAANALFEKILSALELSPSDYEISERVATGASALATVRFSASEGDFGEVGGFSPGEESDFILTTYSLAAMLANAALKKAVWSHLKEALSRVRALG